MKLAAILSYVVIILLEAALSSATQFASHIAVSTPAKSYSHGVGNPVVVRRSFVGTGKPSQRSFRQSPRHTASLSGGYPRVKPPVPFPNEDVPRRNSLNPAPWKYNTFTMEQDAAIPVLPPSPYKVDSPDPESLWPEGLFLPPLKPTHFEPYVRRSDDGQVLSGGQEMDPYLLEGSEALAAVARADRHGFLWFHDIPHIESLLANNELRNTNGLELHRLGSIRHTWPYYRT